MKVDITSVAFIFRDKRVLLIYHKIYKMWVGVGGHLDPDTTPDEQVLREVKEETNLDVRILSRTPSLKVTDNIIRVCPIPSHADMRAVKDHWHYAQYYVCVPLNSIQEVKPCDEEIKEYKWLSEDEVASDPSIEVKTKQIVSKAFKVYRELTY